MSKLGFKNFRDPVVYVLDQELRKRNFKNSIKTSSKEYRVLEEYPCKVVRDSKGLVTRCIYGDTLSNQWFEDIIRDGKGKVSMIKITYPGGSSSKTWTINRDSAGRFESITGGI